MGTSLVNSFWFIYICLQEAGLRSTDSLNISHKVLSVSVHWQGAQAPAPRFLSQAGKSGLRFPAPSAWPNSCSSPECELNECFQWMWTQMAKFNLYFKSPKPRVWDRGALIKWWASLPWSNCNHIPEMKSLHDSETLPRATAGLVAAGNAVISSLLPPPGNLLWRLGWTCTSCKSGSFMGSYENLCQEPHIERNMSQSR